METMPINQQTANYTLHDSAQKIIPSVWSVVETKRNNVSTQNDSQNILI